MDLTLTRYLGLALSLLFLSGCGDDQGKGLEEGPQTLTRQEVCMLDGMILMDYPGPKGQALYKNGEAHFFCDTKGLLSTLYDPTYKSKIKQAYVQDVGGQAWGSYKDGWIEVEKAFLVFDSDQFGAMGPTVATFSKREDADAFVAKHGGSLMPFADLNEDLLSEYLIRVREQLRALSDLEPISDSDASAEIHHHHSDH